MTNPIEFKLAPIELYQGHYFFFDIPKEDPITMKGQLALRMHVTYFDPLEDGRVGVFVYAQFNNEATLYQLHGDDFKPDQAQKKYKLNELVLAYLNTDKSFNENLERWVMWRLAQNLSN